MNDYSPHGRDPRTVQVTETDAKALSTEPLGEYTCFLCKGEFVSPVSEAEAAVEYARNFPDEVNEPHEMVCYVCYEKHFGWAK